MRFVLHGENIPAIRNYILNLQERHKATSKNEFSILDVSSNELSDLVSTPDMFGAKQIVVLDITKMGRMRPKEHIEVITKASNDVVFVIIAQKQLPRTNIFIKNANQLNAKVMSFQAPPPANVFKFVDLVFAKNRSASYKELKKLMLSGEDPIYIFSMLVYGLRGIAYAKFGSPELSKLPPFVRSKVTKQANNFEKEILFDLYNKFYEFDRGAKVGKVSPEVLVPLAIEKVLT